MSDYKTFVCDKCDWLVDLREAEACECPECGGILNEVDDDD